MSRIRLIILSVFAVLAVSAVASASASASNCVAEHEGDYAICHNGAEYEGGLEGTSGVSKLRSKIAGEEITIECTADTFTDTAEDSGTSKGEVTFTGCSVLNKTGEKFANCKVKEPIKFEFKDQLSTPPARIENEFKPAVAGTAFVVIVIENKEGKNCLIKGSYEVTGTQKCEVDTSNAEAESEKTPHQIICKPAGSTLKLKGETATFESTESVKLVGGGNFSFFES